MFLFLPSPTYIYTNFIPLSRLGWLCQVVCFPDLRTPGISRHCFATLSRTRSITDATFNEYLSHNANPSTWLRSWPHFTPFMHANLSIVGTVRFCPRFYAKTGYWMCDRLDVDCIARGGVGIWYIIGLQTIGGDLLTIGWQKRCGEHHSIRNRKPWYGGGPARCPQLKHYDSQCFPWIFSGQPGNNMSHVWKGFYIFAINAFTSTKDQVHINLLYFWH